MRRFADGDWFVVVVVRRRASGDVRERTPPVHYTEAKGLLVVARRRGLVAYLAERQDWPRHLRPGPHRHRGATP